MQATQDRGLIAQSGLGLRADRDRLGHRRRRLDPRRPRPGARQRAGRDPRRHHRQGAARGHPDHTRIVKVGDVEMSVKAVAQLPPGAVPAFLGLVLILAVLVEPWLIRRNVLGRLWAVSARAPRAAGAGRRRCGDRRRPDQRRGRDRSGAVARPVRQASGAARHGGGHHRRHPVAGRLLAAARLLGQSRQLVQSHPGVHGNRPVVGRPHLRDRQWRYRPVGRRRPRDERRHRRLCDEARL